MKLIKDVKTLTRRSFIKLTGSVFFVLATGLPKLGYAKEEIIKINKSFFETPVGKERINLVKARQAGLYKDDIIMRKDFHLAVCNENPMIKKFYSEFAQHSLSEISEELLHTSYKARK